MVEQKSTDDIIPPVVINLSKEIGKLTSDVNYLRDDITAMKIDINGVKTTLNEKILPEIIKLGANLDSYEFKVKTVMEDRVEKNSQKLYDLDKKKLIFARASFIVGLLGGMGATVTVLEIIFHIFGGA